MTPQQHHRQLVEALDILDKDKIVVILAPLPEEEVKYHYEQRLLEHGLGPTSSISELRAQSNGVCQSN